MGTCSTDILSEVIREHEAGLQALEVMCRVFPQSRHRQRAPRTNTCFAAAVCGTQLVATKWCAEKQKRV